MSKSLYRFSKKLNKNMAKSIDFMLHYVSINTLALLALLVYSDLIETRLG